MRHVTVTTFRERFPSLAFDSRELPRRASDLDVLFVSVLCGLVPGQRYSEKDLNAELQRWVLQVGGHFGVDYVTLRRHLVDAQVLTRDAAGASYRVESSARDFTFDPEILSIDVPALLASAEQERAERKRQRLSRT